jgi:hypothetical protein
MNEIEQKIIITTETNAQETAKKVDVLTEATESTAKAQTGATKTTQTQRQALEELAPATTGAVQGFMAMAKAAWVLVANPVGAVLTAIVGAVLLLGKAFFSTEANSNKFGKGLSIISGLFKGLIKALEPVASFLVDEIAKAFDLAGKAILGTSLVLQKTDGTFVDLTNSNVCVKSEIVEFYGLSPITGFSVSEVLPSGVILSLNEEGTKKLPFGECYYDVQVCECMRACF